MLWDYWEAHFETNKNVVMELLLPSPHLFASHPYIPTSLYILSKILYVFDRWPKHHTLMYTQWLDSSSQSGPALSRSLLCTYPPLFSGHDHPTSTYRYSTIPTCFTTLCGELSATQHSSLSHKAHLRVLAEQRTASLEGKDGTSRECVFVRPR